MSTRVDLRSDTVTRPSPPMREAMMSAKLGDDVLGDEPTVQELEARCIGLTGHEAAVFVPSGTMGNQIGIASQTQPGDSILVEDDAHILYYEVGALAVLNGLTVRSMPSNLGVVDPAIIAPRKLTASLHTPGTTLLCLENTHNRHGGTITSPEIHAETAQVARDLGLRVHMDGARLWNAASALGLPIHAFTQHVDSVSLCFSKGLGAPVGSVLCGSASHIEKARIWRKRLGGGMRQSGLLAAACLYAVDHQFKDLQHDHRRARILSEAINALPTLTSPVPETNIVMVDVPDPAEEWVARLAEEGVDCFPFGPKRLRLVFHRDVSDTGLELAIRAFRKLTSS